MPPKKNRAQAGRKSKKPKSSKTRTTSDYSSDWPSHIPLPIEEHVCRLRNAFDFAHNQHSEYLLYEPASDSFVYPADYFMDKYKFWIHWSPQDVLLSEQLIECRSLEEAGKIPTVLPALGAGFHPGLFPSSSSAELIEVIRVDSHRITDFLLAISPLDEEGLPQSRAIMSVIEGKLLPQWVEVLGGAEELEAAKEVAEQALPQLLEQVQHAFKQYPSQKELWGIVFVGRCCQFYQFEKTCVEKQKLAAEELTPHEAQKYMTKVGNLHHIIDPVQDCYTESFMDNMEDMMEWASKTFLG
ncbi:hypothetical protein OF83DRAFT_1087742 [Amylostereum chailletii]|nr:hypothetical protein OF83DRAFT_1087742 [Amylostereum chailletii]